MLYLQFRFFVEELRGGFFLSFFVVFNCFSDSFWSICQTNFRGRTLNPHLLLLNGPPRFLAQILARFLTRFLARFLTRVLGIRKYSVQFYWDRKYSVQFYWDKTFRKNLRNFYKNPYGNLIKSFLKAV